ncbi:MAG: hypothetical protein JNJ49_16715 [Bdellovibrionaceae bacterium]|nr:hypothetical protein [Pseudobdellovibrionaceae bacterium]
MNELIKQPGRRSISIPAKTFLVGEYLALSGGPSIVVTTAPAFKFSWLYEDSRSPELNHPFHPESPAGRFLAEMDLKSGRISIEFNDPYRGSGGFGGSTAEFLGAWMLSRWLGDDAVASSAAEWCVEVRDYRDQVCPVWTSERLGGGRFMDVLDAYAVFEPRASGADLVAQVTGGVAIWDRNKQVMRKQVWPFDGLELSLLRTGRKMKTHEHLKTVRPLTVETQQELELWVQDAVQAFAFADADRLIAAVRGVGKTLEAQGLVAEHTLQALRDLADVTGVRAAKGCGAMGADVVAVLHDPSALPALVELCREHGFSRDETKYWPSAVRIES